MAMLDTWGEHENPELRNMHELSLEPEKGIPR